MKTVVDADACPRNVLETIMNICRKYNVEVWTVANYNHEISSDRHIVVGSDPQEADIKIMNIISPGDMAVTQDFGLAAMILSKGACCISPLGKEYSDSKMDFMLEERSLKAKFRRSGGHTRGPAKRSEDDDKRFAGTFEKALLRLLKIDKAI